MRTVLSLVIAACYMAGPHLALAQDEGGRTPAPVSREQLEPLRFVLSVRDAAGVFVRNLRSDDFVVRVDGAEAVITGFNEVNTLSPDDPLVTGYRVSASERLKEGSPAPEPPIPPRTVLLAFDARTLDRAASEKALATAAAILDRVVLPWDRVAVYRLDGFPIRIAGPTADRVSIIAALEAAARPSSASSSPPLHDPRAGGIPVQQDCAIGLRRLLESVAVLKERTAIFVFSGEVVTAAGPEISSAAGDEETQAETNVAEFVFSHAPAPRLGVDDAVSLASVSGCPVFAFMINGAETDSAEAVENDEESDSADQEMKPKQAPQCGAELLAGVARASGGGVFGFGELSEEIIRSLVDGVGSYYELTVEPPAPAYALTRQIEVAFAARLPFAIMAPAEILTAEPTIPPDVTEKTVDPERFSVIPFPPGRDLPARARVFQAPFETNSGAFVLTEVFTAALAHSAEAPLELERIIMVRAADGALVYQGHKHFLAPADKKLPEKVQLVDIAPGAGPGSSVIVQIREESGTALFAARFDMPTDVPPGARISGPLLFEDTEASMADWFSAEIDDGVRPDRPASFSAPILPGAPMFRAAAQQGGNATLFLMLGDLPPNALPGGQNLDIRFYVSAGRGVYQLFASNQRVLPLPDGMTAAVLADIPLGLAPFSSGWLIIEEHGLAEERILRTATPFTITSYDPAAVERNLRNPDITAIEQ